MKVFTRSEANAGRMESSQFPAINIELAGMQHFKNALQLCIMGIEYYSLLSNISTS